MQAYFNTDSNADYSTYENRSSTTLNNYSSAGETNWRDAQFLDNETFHILYSCQDMDLTSLSGTHRTCQGELQI